MYGCVYTLHSHAIEVKGAGILTCLVAIYSLLFKECIYMCVCMLYISNTQLSLAVPDAGLAGLGLASPVQTIGLTTLEVTWNAFICYLIQPNTHTVYIVCLRVVL